MLSHASWYSKDLCNRRLSIFINRRGPNSPFLRDTFVEPLISTECCTFMYVSIWKRRCNHVAHPILTRSLHPLWSLNPTQHPLPIRTSWQPLFFAATSLPSLTHLQGWFLSFHAHLWKPRPRDIDQIDVFDSQAVGIPKAVPIPPLHFYASACFITSPRKHTSYISEPSLAFHANYGKWLCGLWPSCFMVSWHGTVLCKIRFFYPEELLLWIADRAVSGVEVLIDDPVIVSDAMWWMTCSTYTLQVCAAVQISYIVM